MVKHSWRPVLDMLPKFNLDEINIAAAVDRQVQTEAAVESILDVTHQMTANQVSKEVALADAATHPALQLTLADVQSKTDVFIEAMNDRCSP